MNSLTLKRLGNDPIENDKIFIILEHLINGTYDDFTKYLPTKLGYDSGHAYKVTSLLNYMIYSELIETETEQIDADELGYLGIKYNYPDVTSRGYDFFTFWKNDSLKKQVESYAGPINSIPLEILFDIIPDAILYSKGNQD